MCRRWIIALCFFVLDVEECDLEDLRLVRRGKLAWDIDVQEGCFCRWVTYIPRSSVCFFGGLTLLTLLRRGDRGAA